MIVPSSYDYDKQCIGPYTLPLDLPYISEYCNGDRFHRYQYYTALLQDEKALAVFNVNNYCLCVVRKDMAYETDLGLNPKLELLQWAFTNVLNVPLYEHVGFIKSYHNCLAVTQLPTYLIRVMGSKKACDFEDDFDGAPMVNPPLSLYRELVNSEAKAVYFDTTSNQVKFLFK
ncbi:MAG: hypothetical protein NC548_30770 [Lachnospiraceae bacterium]|nr:hypothetical protein [Lachnospiraceae bacterium]